MSQVQTLNVEAFKDSVFFSLSVKKPGNRKKVRDLAALEAYLKELHAANGSATQAPAVAVPQGFSAAKSNGAVKITKRLLMRKPKTKEDPADDHFEATCSFLNEAKQKLVGVFG